MDKMKIKPARPGMKLVHMPSGIELPDDGGSWPADQFTFRRMRDGDVLEVVEAPTVTDPVAPAAPAAAPAAPAPGKFRDK